jgi:hypothetical protein
MTLSIMAQSVTTLSVMALFKMPFNVKTLNTIASTMTLNNMTFSTLAL